MSKPPQKVWSYTASGFYAQNMGNAQRLPNGNTLICDGPKGKFFEVNSEKKIVWEYMNPVTSTGIVKSIGGGAGMQPNQCFRAYRYPPDYGGLKGKSLTPGEPLEGGNIPTVSTLYCKKADLKEKFYLSTKNLSGEIKINIKIQDGTDLTVKIYSAGGQEIAKIIDTYLTAGEYSYNLNKKKVFEWNLFC